jgi:putative DNA primase/helicase
MAEINGFGEVMAAKGLHCPNTIISDGKIHRFSVDGDKPGSHGWYVLFNDGLPAGSYGSWKTGETFTWSGKNEKAMSEDERAKWRERIAEAKKARDEEQKRMHLEARKKAAWIWENSKPVKDHPYLESKGVESHGLRLHKGSLVISVLDVDEIIHGLQFISADGGKNFLTGSAIVSHFYPIDGDGDTLLVCEGYATGASLHEATGYPAIIAFNAGNLKPVCKSLRKKSPDTKLILCSDDDYLTDGNPGLAKAKEAVEAVDAVLAVPMFRDQAHRGTDFNDLHQAEGLEAVKHQIEDAQKTPDAMSEKPGQGDNKSFDVAQKTVEYLASLSPFMYEQQRQSMADKLGVRVSILDREVEKIRRANSPDKSKNLVEDLEPWPEAVTGSELLDTIHKVALAYVIMPENSAVAFSLWTLLTYSYNAFRILPVLGIVSPEKRCGKTRLLEVLSGLAYRAFPSSNLTPATVYRVIEKCRPCLLIDEADTFLPNSDELRGIINSGHSIKNAFVTRINPDTMEPERFSTWGPKAIALIGRLSGTLSTLEDRSICINLERKLPTETVKRLGLDFDNEYFDLRQKCFRWASDNMDLLKVADPQLPNIDNDRALDNWTPLLAIADLVGDKWPEMARSAMIKIESAKEDDSARVMLLQDIKKVFNERGCERLWTQNLIEALVAMEDRPWAEWKKGKPLSGVSLSRLLTPFGIKPVQLKKDDQNKRGYELQQFKDVLKRYTPSPSPSNRNATPLHSSDYAGFGENRNATLNEKVAGENRLKSAPIAKCSGVAFQKGGSGEEDIKAPDSITKPEQEVVGIW